MRLLYRVTWSLLLWLAAASARAGTLPYDQAPIYYSTTRSVDPVTRLQANLDAGKVHLDSSSPTILLRSLLHELNIPLTSQTLVFSRTSFQRTLISPDNPRAIYFNDDTYVGYVPGGRVIEIASTDPHLGNTFYTVDQHPESAVRFVRQTDDCLQCHASAMTYDMPGLIVRSVFPNSTGEPILPAGTFLTTHESPFAERWGGWYVTGPTHPGMANEIYDDTDPSNPKLLPALDAAARIDATDFPTAQSDPVALLVLGHQVEAHNRLSRALYATESALYEEEALNKELGVSTTAHSPSTLSRIKNACDPLVDYFLFSNEAPLPQPISVTAFAADFSRTGPRDPQGRSLRDFDLRTRLFKYPCSYLIYSRSFDALPAPALDYIEQRLYNILTGKEQFDSRASLSATTRSAILEILRTTKPHLPPYWLH